MTLVVSVGRCAEFSGMFLTLHEARTHVVPAAPRSTVVCQGFPAIWTRWIIPYLADSTSFSTHVHVHPHTHEAYRFPHARAQRTQDEAQMCVCPHTRAQMHTAARKKTSTLQILINVVFIDFARFTADGKCQ